MKNFSDISYVQAYYDRKEQKYLRFVKERRASKKAKYEQRLTRKATRGF
jgi:hypothetical protein